MGCLHGEETEQYRYPVSTVSNAWFSSYGEKWEQSEICAGA